MKLEILQDTLQTLQKYNWDMKLETLQDTRDMKLEMLQDT